MVRAPAPDAPAATARGRPRPPSSAARARGSAASPPPSRRPCARRICSSRRRSSGPARPSSCGKPAVSSSTPLGRPDALGHLGPVVGADQHQVADGRAQLARVEVEEAAVPVEAHRAELTHAATLARRPAGPRSTARRSTSCASRSVAVDRRRGRVGRRRRNGRARRGWPAHRWPASTVARRSSAAAGRRRAAERADVRSSPRDRRIGRGHDGPPPRRRRRREVGRRRAVSRLGRRSTSASAPRQRRSAAAPLPVGHVVEVAGGGRAAARPGCRSPSARRCAVERGRPGRVGRRRPAPPPDVAGAARPRRSRRPARAGSPAAARSRSGPQLGDDASTASPGRRADPAQQRPDRVLGRGAERGRAASSTARSSGPGDRLEPGRARPSRHLRLSAPGAVVDLGVAGGGPADQRRPASASRAACARGLAGPGVERALPLPVQLPPELAQPARRRRRRTPVAPGRRAAAAPAPRAAPASRAARPRALGQGRQLSAIAPPSAARRGRRRIANMSWCSSARAHSAASAAAVTAACTDRDSSRGGRPWAALADHDVADRAVGGDHDLDQPVRRAHGHLDLGQRRSNSASSASIRW